MSHAVAPWHALTHPGVGGGTQCSAETCSLQNECGFRREIELADINYLLVVQLVLVVQKKIIFDSLVMKQTILKKHHPRKTFLGETIG